jgi:hypothetical protein
MVTCDHTKIMGEIKIDKIKSTTIVIDSSINLEGNKVLLDPLISEFIKTSREMVKRSELLIRNLTNERN